MANISSAYPFTVFLSSTVYNLVDLRAELKRYLAELGYTPYLSEGEGFHDSTPEMTPYESCLKVLSTASIMVLIIDGKYGKAFKWDAWNDIVKNRTVSPTHAEYLLANATQKRTLVFIRKELLTYYEMYRTAKKNGEKGENLRKIVSKVLPEYISFETLEFIHEIKTTEPIPWIKEFIDVTDIKEELKSKMLNELAELFLIKNQHVETLIRAFSSALMKMNPEERVTNLRKIGVTNEFIEKVDILTQENLKLKDASDLIGKQLTEKEDELAHADNKKQAEVKKLQAEISSLKDEKEMLAKKIEVNESYNKNILTTSTNNSAYFTQSNKSETPFTDLIRSLRSDFAYTNSKSILNISHIDPWKSLRDDLAHTDLLKSIDSSVLHTSNKIVVEKSTTDSGKLTGDTVSKQAMLDAKDDDGKEGKKTGHTKNIMENDEVQIKEESQLEENVENKLPVRKK